MPKHSINTFETNAYNADFIGTTSVTRQDYLRKFKEISPATVSRDLKAAVDEGLLKKSGDKRMSRYEFNI